MRKLLCFLVVLFVAGSLYAQPIITKGGEIKDLKECVSKYCLVVFSNAGAGHTASACTDEGCQLNFADRVTGKVLKINNVIALFNLMDKEGWRYVDKFEDQIDNVNRSYLFEKKETVEVKKP